MKNQKTLITSVLFLALVFAGKIALAGTCNVTSELNPEPGETKQYTGSLSSALDSFNSPGNNRACDSEIKITVDEPIEIRQPLYINSTKDTGGLKITGDSDSGSVFQSYIEEGTDDTILTVEGVAGVEISNITVKGNSHRLLKCENAAELTLEKITIVNAPKNAITIEGCDSVTLKTITVKSEDGSISGSIDNAFVREGEILVGDALISITGTATSEADTVVIEGLELNDVEGTGLNVQYATNVSITDFTVNSLNEGLAANFDGITAFNKLGMTAYGVQNGIVMNDVTGTDGIEEMDIHLTGIRESVGDGLVLDQYAVKLDFKELIVTQFGQNGVVIKDASNENVFEGNIEVTNNAANGFYITDQASANVITGATIKQNDNCGIMLDSTNTNIIYNVELPGNGYGCPIGATEGKAVEVMDDGTVTIVARHDTKILVDFDQTALNNGTAYYLELHSLTRNGSLDDDGGTSDTSDTGASSARTKKETSGVIGTIGKFSPITSVKGLSIGGKSGSGSTPVYYSYYPDSSSSSVLSPGGETSSIEEFLVAELPEEKSGVSSAAYFFAMAETSDRYLLGIWSGTTNFTSDNCYYDETAGVYYRVWNEDEYLDTDGDGLTDREEDADSDCIVDGEADETDPDVADTDGDGLDDYTEVVELKTDPNLTDTDGDGLNDGDEDVNHDGTIDDTTETNPLVTDSDSDGKNDAEERALGTDPNVVDSDGDGTDDSDDTCPTINSADGKCYYESCSPGVPLAFDQDTDGDGIMDDDEDANWDCERSADETDAGNPDTDGDGIGDGVEDYNQNGQYDADEYDPLSADTDGDCISDGDEDKNGDFIVDSEGGGETSPILADTDGDGMGDGDEDLNCDGDADSGETNSSMTDTDGDGTDDKNDICPWSIKQNCVVRYCDVSGFDVDTDGDDLFDKEEDSNGDCTHTVTEKESDPLDADTDDEGLEDDLEACYGTNPNIQDTDADGRSDYEEVKNSGDICQPMYNMGDSNPLRAEYGNCSLNATKDATSGRNLPIIGMVLAALIALRIAKLVIQMRNEKN